MRAADGQVARRAWEGDGRIDLRSVTNSLRQLPYHVAWQRGFRQAATVLNPTIAIDIALETARDLEDGVSTELITMLMLPTAHSDKVDWSRSLVQGSALHRVHDSFLANVEASI